MSRATKMPRLVPSLPTSPCTYTVTCGSCSLLSNHRWTNNLCYHLPESSVSLGDIPNGLQLKLQPSSVEGSRKFDVLPRERAFVVEGTHQHTAGQTTNHQSFKSPLSDEMRSLSVIVSFHHHIHRPQPLSSATTASLAPPCEFPDS